MEKVPSQMTVIAISKPGGPDVLVPETRSVPAPGPGEILILVALALLEHQHRVTLLGQTHGRHRAAKARANDHIIISLIHLHILPAGFVQS